MCRRQLLYSLVAASSGLLFRRALVSRCVNTRLLRECLISDFYNDIVTMAEEQVQKEKVIHTYPLVRHSDMPEEMRSEATELTVTACEKFATNNELAARMIKEAMDKKFGPSYHVVVGEGYGFEITYECKNILYMYFGGSQAICIWKCS